MLDPAIVLGAQDFLRRNQTAKVLLVGGLDSVAGYRWRVHDRIILWDDERAVRSYDTVPRPVSIVIVTRTLDGWAFTRLQEMIRSRPGVRFVNHCDERDAIEILKALDATPAEDGSSVLEESPATTSGAGSPVAEAISGEPRAEEMNVSRQAVRGFVGEHGRFDTEDGTEEIRRLTTAALLDGNLRTDEETVRGIFYELRSERRREHEEFVRTGRPPARGVGRTRLVLAPTVEAATRPAETLLAPPEDSERIREMVVTETRQPATPNINEALEVLKCFRGQVEGVLTALDVLLTDYERLLGVEQEFMRLKETLRPFFKDASVPPQT